jgi:hypothetical protein
MGRQIGGLARKKAGWKTGWQVGGQTGRQPQSKYKTFTAEFSTITE